MHTDRDFGRYVDGELPAEQASDLRNAADRDPALYQRIETLRALKAGMLAEAPPAPPGFADRVLAAAALAPPAPILDLADLRRFVRRSLVAAAILGALGLTYLAVEVGPRLLQPTPLQAQDPLLKGQR